MNEINLIPERRNLQQIKSSILYKAEIIEKKFKKAGKTKNTIEDFRFYYSQAAELETQIVKLLLAEGKEEKIHPNLVSAITCYIKAKDFDNSANLLKEYYPKGSKYDSIETVRKLWKNVAP